MVSSPLIPFGATNPNNIDSSIQEAKQTQSQAISEKRNLLKKYITNPNSTDEDFDQIIERYPNNIPYSVMEAMNYSESNVTLFPTINSLFNNYQYYYSKDVGAHILKEIKNHNPQNFPFTRTYNTTNNPYYDHGVSNSEFNSIWKALRQKYPILKDDDKHILSSLFTIEQLKHDVGYNNDQSKSKITNDDIVAPTIDLSTPTTKEDLYRYYYNLSLLYSNHDDNIYANIHNDNSKDLLKSLRAIFITLTNIKEDLQYRMPLTGSEYGLWIYNVISNGLKLESAQYLITSICLSPTHTTNKDIEVSLTYIFNKVLSVIPKDTIIVPVNATTCNFLCADDINTLFYKYNKHLVSTAFIASDNTNGYTALYNQLHNKSNRVTVKRDNSFTTENILTRLYSKEYQEEANVNLIDNKKAEITSLDSINVNDIAPTMFQHSNYQYTYDEFRQILSTLPNYNIVYIGRTINNNNKSKRYSKFGEPYIIMRKGKDKRFYYLNPTITAAYSTQEDYQVEEPLTRLYAQEHLPIKDIYSYKKQIEEKFRANGNKGPLVFYNTDFAHSTYIASEIRNRMNYQEGTSSPRIMVLDFETEKNAIKVRGNSKTIDAKCRLVSLFDLLEKKIYCAVLKDPFHHKDINLSNITEHDNYPVYIDEFYDERELWGWLNQKLYELDPDIITGWNVDKFDLTYAIVRCATLGIPFRSKYGDFHILQSRNKEGQEVYDIGADGLVVIDYRTLYRVCQFIKRENYKLEYICQIELNKGKRQMIVDDHDEMYYQHLRDYILYNIEDDERILDLENKLNYLKFQYEICNVCNISWDDIFSKTKLIDGLVYNHTWDNNNTLIKERNYNGASNNLKNILSSEVQEYVEETGDTTISDNNINLTEYTVDEDNEDEKGYEGAVVLTPQKGVKELVADLDASQMYPRLMIRSNIFKDTMCGIIAIDNEKYAEQWLYDRESFPNEILVKIVNTGKDPVKKMSKDEFGEFLKDKILTPFGTIYWHPSIKRSLVSNILIGLIENRSKYKKLRNKVTGKYSDAKDANNVAKMEEYSALMDRYDNLQTAYKALINSFYGVMGMSLYRLSDVFSAASITASGRELTRMVAYYTSLYMDEMIKQKRENVPFTDVPITVKSLIGLEKPSNRPNVLYGDTDSIFVHIGKVVNAIYNNITYDEKLDHAWNIIEKISQYVNDYVIRDILERKNINFNDSDKDYNYEYKKELVMGKVLFGTQKKHYAMHLSIKEGKRLDKIEIKGMLAIKSDTARFSRTLLKDLTEFILKHYDPNDVIGSNNIMMERYNKAINDIGELIRCGDVTIGSPASLTQDLQYYSTIQAHIRGMMIYDIIYGHEFMAGDKGYQFYLSDINWSKISSSEQQFLTQFEKKYGKMKWYDSMMKTYSKDKFFNSITIPSENDFLDTSIFTIDEEKTKKTLIKEKVSGLMQLVGINALDEKDVEKKRKTMIRKFDFSNLTV